MNERGRDQDAPKELADVLLRRLERHVLDDHLRCARLDLLLVLRTLSLLRTTSSPLHNKLVPIQHKSIQALQAATCSIWRAEPNEAVAHAEACTRARRIGLGLNAREREVGQVPHDLGELFEGGAEGEVLDEERRPGAERRFVRTTCSAVGDDDGRNSRRDDWLRDRGRSVSDGLVGDEHALGTFLEIDDRVS